MSGETIAATRVRDTETPANKKIRIGFIVANLLQLLHFSKIRRHLDEEITVYVEVRDDDFGLTRQLIEEHFGNCRIKWVKSANLKSIDGECDVLVCQTPIPILQFFEKSLVAAEQYSLAKEHYQYGIWRSHASLNLMFGEYSANMVSAFSHAVKVGNPLFDGHLPVEGILPAPSPAGERLRVLYMPTYGDLSDRASVLRALVDQDIDLHIKAHHADFEIKELAEAYALPVHLSESNPVDLIAESDLVVSDYSGAIYDALAMRTPVALVSALNAQSADLKRLSSDDLSHASVVGLASSWSLDEPLRTAYETSRAALAEESAYRGFIDKFYVNPGSAGLACAHAITDLAINGAPSSFAVDQVHTTTQQYIARNRELQSRAKRAERKVARKRMGLFARARNQTPWHRKWAALNLMLKNDSPRVIALKSSRYLVRSMPGGDHALTRLRRLRTRLADRRMGASRGTGGSAELDQVRELSPQPHLRRVQLMQLVQKFLDAAGVDYRTASSLYWAYIAVREEDLDTLYKGLRSLEFGGEPRVKLWLGSGARYSTIRYTDTLRFSDLTSCESLVVGIADESGTQSTKMRTSGVEVLVLEHRDARLVSRRGRAEKPDWTKEFAHPPSESPMQSIALHGHHTIDDEFVDVVYTWVDSTDPEWMADRAKWSGQSEIVMASAANDERYLDRDELRYSIRSVWLYAPFVRNIYIVTHGHRPSWLVDDNDRIRVVPHSDIFPDPSVLPTFNSHSIEACLHRIPGLSERFLYFNDDFFLGHDTRYDDFFTKAGLIKTRFSPSSFVADDKPSPESIPTDWASYNAVKLIRDDFGLSFGRKHKHVPYALRKSILEEMEERYPEAFSRTRASRFRDHQDYAIPSMLAHYYGIASAKAVEWENIPWEYAYADTGRADFKNRVTQIKQKRPKFICLNGTLHRDIDFATQAIMLREFLDSQYSVSSPFERPCG